jgi:hypothetical protein
MVLTHPAYGGHKVQWSIRHISPDAMRSAGIDTATIMYNPEVRPPDPVIYPTWSMDIRSWEGLIIRGYPDGWYVTGYVDPTGNGPWRGGETSFEHVIEDRREFLEYLSEWSKIATS